VLEADNNLVSDFDRAWLPNFYDNNKVQIMTLSIKYGIIFMDLTIKRQIMHILETLREKPEPLKYELRGF
jgi:hypothetical protein